MEKDKFIALLSKKLSNEISVTEQEQLNQALQQEEFRVLATQLTHYFSEKPAQQDFSAQLGEAWQKIAATEGNPSTEQFNFTKPKQNLFSAAWFKIAATLFLICTIGLLAYYRFNMATTTLVATNDKVFKVLEDGTGIWLNKKSTITYNHNFGKQQREITLKGEAYFDVVKNADVPLIIHAGGIDIEVKGTVFNVNAYPENTTIEVALIKGAIAVTDRKNVKNTVLLKPNDKLVFSNEAALQNHFNVVALKPSLIWKEANWTADTLVFDKEKLRDLALKLEKKYDLKIEIRSEVLKEKRFSGTFTTETIHQVLEALKLSYPLTYTIDKKLVIIKD